MDRQIGQAGENGGQFGDGGAVSFHLGIGLLERHRCAHRKGTGAGEFSGQVSGQCHDALTVDHPGEFRFTLDIDHALGADVRPSRDADGTAERVIAELMDGEAIDLPYDLAVEIDHQRAFLDLILDPVFGQV